MLTEVCDVKMATITNRHDVRTSNERRATSLTANVAPIPCNTCISYARVTLEQKRIFRRARRVRVAIATHIAISWPWPASQVHEQQSSGRRASLNAKDAGPSKPCKTGTMMTILFRTNAASQLLT